MSVKKSLPESKRSLDDIRIDKPMNAKNEEKDPASTLNDLEEEPHSKKEGIRSTQSLEFDRGSSDYITRIVFCECEPLRHSEDIIYESLQ